MIAWHRCMDIFRTPMSKFIQTQEDEGMLLEKQFAKVLAKLHQIERTYDSLIFEPVQEVETKHLVCLEHHRNVPTGEYKEIKKGETWGGSDKTGWFVGTVKVPEELDGQDLYLNADTGAIEAMLFVDGVPKGIYAHKIVENNRGNHHMLLMKANAQAGEEIPIAVEAYCWHNGVGTQPFAEPDLGDKISVYGGVWLCTRNEIVKEFVFSLRILNQIQEYGKDDFRRARIENTLWKVFELVPQKPEEYPKETWMEAIRRATECMQEALSEKNAEVAPSVGFIGHSHMDTAWQWTIDETIRKCARTYSNVLNLMDQYDHYSFFQSSAYHGELMRRNYPSIYEGIKQRVAEGRYEPNGGAWIECDCNLVSGESMIRQFLWGQRWTKEHYNYESDIFWLPDTFGYSAAIPQILAGCNIKYFMTTKLFWNDTNQFPYDTFIWRGIDGTSVFTHFNDMGAKPDPARIIDNHQNMTRLKRVNQDRLIAYGYGDGGGGPSYDLVEMADRIKDINGCPKGRHTTVSDFMKKLEQEAVNPPVYAGELYLEGHRGTLTSFHDIKKNNRKAEIAFHDLEFAEALAWLNGKQARPYTENYETFLVNQFHDILPGTCIGAVNERAIREMKEVIRDTEENFLELMQEDASADSVSFVNTLPWERNWAYVSDECGSFVEGSAQKIVNLEGETLWYTEALQVPGLAVSNQLRTDKKTAGESAFCYDGHTISSPMYEITFDENGYIDSLFDKTANRELKRTGAYPLNAFFLPEDIPGMWDNWDIDADVIELMKPVEHALVERKVVSDGPLQLRVRSTFALTEKTTVYQDMVIYANRQQIDFETKVEWHEKHHLLKTGFDMDINAFSARHEIQFGYSERTCFKNNNYEKAMFEVLNHKYTDVSEIDYGAAIINDCKYGISVDGTQLALSLLKSGMHPDPSADEGVHSFTYSLVTHNGFNWENVIRPAYELNYPIHAVKGCTAASDSLVSCDKKNVIIETVKVAEEKDGLIIRMYESERSGGRVKITVPANVKKVLKTNLLEEVQEELECSDGCVELNVRAFEIVTLKLMF